ncbi:hypothetical protein C8Q76DRAFT_383456 [Earliella scabrosa]|nr:hypothetical protein C8Q76DRAFT_383456 [Earliella scabrosa]
MLGPVEWDSEEERAHRRHRHKASTIHGWLVKVRGTLFGSESTRRAGIREMQEARALRTYRKEHPEHYRSQQRGGIFWIFPRRPRSRSHHHHDRHHSHRERRHHHHRPQIDAYYGERHHGPWLHFHRRVHSHHHGTALLIAGYLLGRRDWREEGRHRIERARKERRRERRKRKRQRRDEAVVIKIDSAINKNRWWRR